MPLAARGNADTFGYAVIRKDDDVLALVVQVDENIDPLLLDPQGGHSKSEDKKKDFHVVERSYGSFRRSIRLPGVVDPDKVKAVFEKGVLRVTLPKPQEAKQKRRRIEVKSAKQWLDREREPGPPTPSASSVCRPQL